MSEGMGAHTGKFLFAAGLVAASLAAALFVPAKAQWHHHSSAHGGGVTHVSPPSSVFYPPRSVAYLGTPMSPLYGCERTYVRRGPAAIFGSTFPSYFPWSDTPPPAVIESRPVTPSLLPALSQLESQVYQMERLGRLSPSDAADLLQRIADVRRLEMNERDAGNGWIDNYQYAYMQQNIASLQDQIRARTSVFSASAVNCRRCGHVMTDPNNCCDREMTATCSHRHPQSLSACCRGENAVTVSIAANPTDSRPLSVVFKDLESLILKYNNAGRLGTFDLDSFGERLAELKYKQQLESRGGRLSKHQEDDLRQDLRTVEQELLSHS